MIVGIPTRNRPHLLSRCLTNLAKNARLYGHGPLFVVVDDSWTDDGERATREAVAGIDARIEVIGRFERLEMISRLWEAAIPDDPPRFALDRSRPDIFAPGAARNVLLLLAAGQKMLMVDDDTTGDFVSFDIRPRYLPPPDWSSDDPTRFRLFPSRTAALDAAGARPRADALEAAEEWLRGSPLAIFGVVGHSGMQNPGYSAQRAGANPEWAYAREVHRCVTQPTFAPLGHCQTITIGLNGEVPPFPPHHYAEDGAFGAAMRATKPGQCAVFLPSAAIHDPEDVRPCPDLSKVVRANDVLTLLLRVCIPGSMQSVGAQLVAISRAGFFEAMVTNLAHQAKPDSAVAPEFGGSFLRLSEYVERYGRLLEAWPAMLSAAGRAPVFHQNPATTG